MELLGRGRLDDFCRGHADARSWISNWISEVEEAVWKRPSDVKEKYASASILSDNRVVFNVKGNRYRMLVQIAYNTGKVVVKKIGTHDDYDTWDL